MTSHLQTFHAVVVGGGLVGKTAALALTQSGLRTALVASPAAPLPPGAAFDSRIYALSSSSQALLERLRVWQALDRARLGPVFDMRVFGDARAELHFSAFQASVPQLAWIVESSLIEQSLDTALRFQPNLTWFDSRAQGMTVDAARRAGHARERRDARSRPRGRRRRRAFVGPRADGREGDAARLPANGRRRELQGGKAARRDRLPVVPRHGDHRAAAAAGRSRLARLVGPHRPRRRAHEARSGATVGRSGEGDGRTRSASSIA